MSNSNSSTVTATASLQLNRDEIGVLLLALGALVEVMPEFGPRKDPSLAVDDDNEHMDLLLTLLDNLCEAAADIESQS